MLRDRPDRDERKIGTGRPVSGSLTAHNSSEPDLKEIHAESGILNFFGVGDVTSMSGQAQINFDIAQ